MSAKHKVELASQVRSLEMTPWGSDGKIGKEKLGFPLLISIDAISRMRDDSLVAGAVFVLWRENGGEGPHLLIAAQEGLCVLMKNIHHVPTVDNPTAVSESCHHAFAAP